MDIQMNPHKRPKIYGAFTPEYLEKYTFDVNTPGWASRAEMKYFVNKSIKAPGKMCLRTVKKTLHLTKDNVADYYKSDCESG